MPGSKAGLGRNAFQVADIKKRFLCHPRPRKTIMKEYEKFVAAAEKGDGDTLLRLIREHKELHDYPGVDGCLTEVLHRECPQFLAAAFAAGLHPDSGPPGPPITLLQQAACNSDVELIRLAIRHGADIERRNEDGETVLGYAASWGSLETVRTLVEAGANVNAVEGKEEGRYSTAVDATHSSNPEYDRAEIRAYLLQHGARRYRELP